jgi:hypothetical protein
MNPYNITDLVFFLYTRKKIRRKLVTSLSHLLTIQIEIRRMGTCQQAIRGHALFVKCTAAPGRIGSWFLSHYFSSGTWHPLPSPSPNRLYIVHAYIRNACFLGGVPVRIHPVSGTSVHTRYIHIVVWLWKMVPEFSTCVQPAASHFRSFPGEVAWTNIGVLLLWARDITLWVPPWRAK